jgi:hypothetical protein
MDDAASLSDERGRAALSAFSSRYYLHQYRS